MSKKYIPKSWKAVYVHYLVDTYFISYPKCGRTWLRMLIGTALNEMYDLKLEKDQLVKTLPLTRGLSHVPTIRFTHDDDPHRKQSNKLTSDKNKYKNKNVFFLIRDPRDVIVSSYYQHKYRENVQDIKYLTISEFIRYDRGGIKNIVNFYNIWQENKSIPRFFEIIRYEDMSVDIYTFLVKLFKSMNIEMKQESIRNSIDINDFKNLQRQEKKGELNSDQFSKKINIPQNEKYLKVRKGKTGGYKDELQDDDIIFLNSYINDNLSDYYDYYKYD